MKTIQFVSVVLFAIFSEMCNQSSGNKNKAHKPGAIFQKSRPLGG